tara:strand:- start:2095 stop:2346 length:252 start_codon:yes stop_codon:yes gene_type:complete
MDKKMKLIIKAIEEIIEDSNTISDIRNNLFDIEERQKYDHDYAIEQISQGVNDLHYDIQDDLDSLQQQIDELKDYIEKLTEKL